MKTKTAEQIIQAATAALAGGYTGSTIDVSVASAIGKHVYGAINDFAVSPKVRAMTIVEDGCRELLAADAWDEVDKLAVFAKSQLGMDI